MAERTYSHTQVSYWLTGLSLLSAAIVAVILWFKDPPWVSFAVLAFGVVVALIFSRLTVVVDDRAVHLWFGLRWPRKSFPLSEVSEVRIVRNPWWYGWGIRWIPRGWLYNVEGLGAIELRMRNGRRYRIGTDEPERLETAIKNALKRA